MNASRGFWAGLGLACLAAFIVIGPAAADLAGRPGIAQSPALEQILRRAADAARALPLTNALKDDELAITLVDLSRSDRPVCASLRGEVPIYPASVVKLFYLVAAHRWLEDGRLKDGPELQRALRDMIVDSSNDATHYIVDLLTDTTSGPELPDDALAAWQVQRQAVNRYFATLGYTRINADKKPWCEGPYGRESQAIRKYTPNRNQLTTDATARILLEIVTGKAVTASRCRQMMRLLKRDPASPTDDPEDQAHGFTGIALANPARGDVRIWSKAGWTSETRHDAAYLEVPDGRRFILVTFTLNHANQRDIIPTVARTVLDGLAKP